MSRWITRVERTLTEDVPGPPDAVRDFYTDLHNIKLVHPLVVSVRSVDRSESADSRMQTYRVGDRIPFGPLHVRTNYVVRLCVPVTGDVLSEARQFPRVRLTSRVSFDAVGSGTRVVERIRIEAPWPLASFTIRKAVEAHADMLGGIRRRFEPAQG